MAFMGLRLAQRANGVSELHGDVSRGMFQKLWPGFEQADVPIGSITNGVHAPTWVAREVFELASKQGATAEIERYMAIPGQALSYKIGALKIRELRQKYEKQLGGKFNLSAFHDE